MLLLIMFWLGSVWRPSFLDFCWDAWLLYSLLGGGHSIILLWLMVSWLICILYGWIRKASSCVSCILMHESSILLYWTTLIWIGPISVALVCPAGRCFFFRRFFAISVMICSVCLIGYHLRLIAVTRLGLRFLCWSRLVVRGCWLFGCRALVIMRTAGAFLLGKDTCIQITKGWVIEGVIVAWPLIAMTSLHGSWVWNAILRLSLTRLLRVALRFISM